jgi:hypothetical protein
MQKLSWENLDGKTTWEMLVCVWEDNTKVNHKEAEFKVSDRNQVGRYTS